MDQSVARSQVERKTAKTAPPPRLQFAIASVVSAFYFLRSLDSDILGESRNLSIFYYYGKLRYQRLRAHRTQRSSRHVTERRQTRSRDQRSYRYPHARAFTEMGFGPWEIRWRDQLRRAEHYRARSQDSDSQGTRSGEFALERFGR